MAPKTSQNHSFFEAISSAGFLFDFAFKFQHFRSRPTHDFTAIYSTFVGCIIFREVRKVPKKHFKKTPKMIPKSMQNHFKNLSKNYARKKSEKTTEMSRTWVQKATRKRRLNSGNRPRDAPRTTQEPPGSPKGALKHPTAAKRTSKDPKK